MESCHYHYIVTMEEMFPESGTSGASYFFPPTIFFNGMGSRMTACCIKR